MFATIVIAWAPNTLEKIIHNSEPRHETRYNIIWDETLGVKEAQSRETQYEKMRNCKKIVVQGTKSRGAVTHKHTHKWYTKAPRMLRAKRIGMRRNNRMIVPWNTMKWCGWNWRMSLVNVADGTGHGKDNSNHNDNEGHSGSDDDDDDDDTWWQLYMMILMAITAIIVMLVIMMKVVILCDNGDSGDCWGIENNTAL